MKLVSHFQSMHGKAHGIVTKLPALMRQPGWRSIQDVADYRMATKMSQVADNVEAERYDVHSPSVLEDFYVLCCIFYYQWDESIVPDAVHDALAAYLLTTDYEFVNVTRDDLKASTRPAKYPYYLERLAELLRVEE